jgi:SAM-dependent methyltransferase
MKQPLNGHYAFYPNYKDSYFDSEMNFSRLYPSPIQQLDKMHWSPLAVIRQAADFLVDKPALKILDIGSGAGKLCLAGAYYKPSAFFYGIEQRISLIESAESARATLGLKNVQFIHGNFTQLDFQHFDRFYFYNSFYENLPGTNKIDNRLEYSPALYDYYNRYLAQKLQNLPAGIKLVTLHGFDLEMPDGYQEEDRKLGGQLKYWIKK